MIETRNGLIIDFQPFPCIFIEFRDTQRSPSVWEHHQCPMFSGRFSCLAARANHFAKAMIMTTKPLLAEDHKPELQRSHAPGTETNTTYLLSQFDIPVPRPAEQQLGVIWMHPGPGAFTFGCLSETAPGTYIVYRCRKCPWLMLEGGAVSRARKWDRTPHDENLNRWGGKTEGNSWRNDTPRVCATTTF